MASRQSLTEGVVKTLRDQILQGELRPGDRLVEGKISAKLGVSRVPVREALHLLAAEGVVTIEARKGAVVTVFSAAQVRELVEVRATLEALNAKLAARRNDPAQLAILEHILKQGNDLTGKDDLVRIAELNIAFHDALVKVAANSILQDMMRSLRERTALIFTSRDDGFITKTWQEHEAILRAVIAGDGEMAALLALRHVYSAAQIDRPV